MCHPRWMRKWNPTVTLPPGWMEVCSLISSTFKWERFCPQAGARERKADRNKPRVQRWDGVIGPRTGILTLGEGGRAVPPRISIIMQFSKTRLLSGRARPKSTHRAGVFVGKGGL